MKKTILLAFFLLSFVSVAFCVTGHPVKVEKDSYGAIVAWSIFSDGEKTIYSNYPKVATDKQLVPCPTGYFVDGQGCSVWMSGRYTASAWLTKTDEERYQQILDDVQAKVDGVIIKKYEEVENDRTIQSLLNMGILEEVLESSEVVKDVKTPAMPSPATPDTRITIKQDGTKTEDKLDETGAVISHVHVTP